MVSKNMKIKGVMFVIIIIFVSFGCALNIQPIVTGKLDLSDYNVIGTGTVDSHTYNLVSFSSYEEFSRFLNNCSSNGYRDHYTWSFEKGGIAPEAVSITMDAAVGSDDGEGWSVDFSETNIQVEGVDEPDSVKTDGKYIYLVSGQTVYIILAYPAEDAKILSKIELDQTVSNIFINGDKLVVFGSSYSYFICEDKDDDISIPSPWYSSRNSFVKIYDLADREEPELERDVVIAGNYYNARMIGDYVYLITTQYSYDLEPMYEDNDTIIPLYSVNGEIKRVGLDDICCIDIPSYSYTLTHVVSINVKDDSEDVVDKIFTLSNSQTMYVSKNNIYLTYQTSRSDYDAMQEIIDEVVMPLLPEKTKSDILAARQFDIDDYNKNQVITWILDGFYKTLTQKERTEIQTTIQKRIHRTMIHRISVSKGKIEYMGNGSVPGRMLNQFSMDEHNGFLRVATQIDLYWYYSNVDIEKCTNVFVLDEELNIAGSVENIAPGENMHSARFAGSRVYLVTFKNIDPFFVIDLSDPYSPEILGELKIPGYSDYLHPYNENYIIGVGRDADETIDADKIHSDHAVYYTAILGVKIALFDVSDPQNPKEVSKVIIGGRGTSTPVLYDHKAFLFDREKELLVLPISLYECEDEKSYGGFEFQGAYVYHLSIENGFEYQGRITHKDDEEPKVTEDYWYYWGSDEVTRSLYIEDVLYTFSNSMIKMNSLDDLSEINSIQLDLPQPIIYY